VRQSLRLVDSELVDRFFLVDQFQIFPPFRILRTRSVLPTCRKILLSPQQRPVLKNIQLMRSSKFERNPT
jgi:hypothetical protein